MSGRQDVFQSAMSQGHSAAWDQLWDRAADFYRQALDEFPNNPQALSNLGLALFEQQRYDEALQIYIRAARSSPEDPVALEKIAQLYERLGRLEPAGKAFMQAAENYAKARMLEKAIENWRRVTRLDPANLPAQSRLAMVYERTGDKPRAVESFLAIASILQAIGDVQKAARSVQHAFELDPNSESARQAIELLRKGLPLPPPPRPRGATAPLRMAQVRQMDAGQALTLADGEGDPVALARRKALTVLAGMLFEGSEDETDPVARRDLQSIVGGAGATGRSHDHSLIVLHLSQVVDNQTNGNHREAAAELERAIESGLDDPAAYFDLGCLLAMTDRPESALRQLQRAEAGPEFSLGAHLLKAETLHKLGRAQEAATEYLEELKEADAQTAAPEYADELRQLYEPLVEAYRHEANAEAHERICDNVSSLLMRVDWRAALEGARGRLPVHSGGGMPAPVAEVLTEVKSGQTIESLARIHEMAGRGSLRAAMEEAFFALKDAPSYLPLHTYMGELLIQLGQTNEAIAKFIVAARAYSIRGEPQRAVDLYRRVIRLAPMDMAARGRLIDLLSGSGQTEEAIREYMDLAELYYSLADLDMVRKTYTEALRLAQTSRVDRSLRVQIMRRMADIYQQSLDWRQALRVFEQIRTMQPEDEAARASILQLNLRMGQESQALSELDNYLTFLLSAGQRDKAIAFVEVQVAENDGRASLRMRLAELYKQAGRTTDAVHQLDALGDALLEAGDKAGAVRAIDALLALNPPNRAEYEKLRRDLN
jgi:tetratricopeptide (TPR) repeat protein